MPANLLPTLAVFLSVLVIASDLYARRVPNMGLFGALLAGIGALVFAWINGTGGPLWPAVLGLAIGLAAFLPFHIFGWMGAGDVKFFAVIGFLLGAKALLPIWIISNLIAGVHSALILLSRHWLVQAMPAWSTTQTRLSNSTLGRHMLATRQGRKGLPYAAWLGVSALIVIFNPTLMHW